MEIMLGLFKQDWRFGGIESRANVRVSFLFLEPLLSFLYIKKRKKGSKKFDMKEKLYLINRLER